MRIENGCLVEVSESDIIDGKFIIPEGVTSIGRAAFWKCSGLEEITIPVSVSKIGGSAFLGCTGLEKVMIPEGVTSIGMGTFSGCTGLKEVIISDSVTNIDWGAFLGCTGLKKITIPKGVTRINAEVFSECTGLEEVTVPEGVTEISNGAFYGCTGLEKVTIPEGVTRIGREAFWKCNRLKEITIPRSIEKIGESAFSGCTELTKIITDEGAVTLVEGTFNVCEFSEELLNLLHDPNFVKNFNETIELVKKSQLLNSKDYNEDVMTKVIINALNTVDLDELRKMLTIKEVSPTDIEQYFNEESELYKKYFDRTVEVEGEIGIAIQIINGIEKSELFDKKGRLDFYKKVNELIKDKKVRTIEEIVGEISPEQKDKVKDLSKRINEKTITENLLSSEEELKIGILNVFAGLPNQGEFVYKKIKDLMIEGYKNTGVLKKEELIGKIKEELGEGVGAGVVITSKIEDITKEFEKYFENNEKTINRSAVEIIDTVGEKLGRGYIRKLSKIQSTKMKEEDLDKWIEEVNSPQITKESIKHRLKVTIKPGKEEEVYKELDKRNAKVRGVVSYNQMEAMFGGIREPYSEGFREYFKRHSEEILNNSEYYTRLSDIHNNYESMMSNPNNTRVEEWNVKKLLEVIDSAPIEGQREGDEELARIALSAVPKGFDVKNFRRAQELYDKMREREDSTIPPVTTNVHKKYRGRMLRPDDPLAIFVGTLTDCCQELDNAGEDCMTHSVTDKNGGVFVVEEVDDSGKPVRLVAQSWVWRNGSRFCFDNIEQEEKHFEDIATEEESRAVFKVYKEAAERALELDKELFDELERKGQVSKEDREKYELQEVTVGIGYNAQKELGRLINEGRLKEANDVAPEGYSGYRDSKTSYIIAAKKDEDNSEKQLKKEETKRTTHSSFKFGYKKRNEVQIISVIGLDDYDDDYEDYDEDYDEEVSKKDIEAAMKKRQRIEMLDGKIEQIKEIEKEAFSEEERNLQEINYTEDLKRKYELMSDRMNVAIDREGTFYIVYEETESKVKIPGMAVIPQNEGSKLLMQETLYKIILDAKKRGKNIEVTEERDKSGIDYEEFSNLSEKEMQDEIEKIHKKQKGMQRKRIIGDER